MRGKCRFWFEYVENPTSQSWGGGHWLFYKSPSVQIPIKVGLAPAYPLDFLSFKVKRPAPEEIEIIIYRHTTLDISPDDIAELDQLLRQFFGHQFRSELIPGKRLEIYDDTFLSIKIEEILGRTKILDDVIFPWITNSEGGD